VKLKPTKEQKKTLNKWFGAYRWVYNKAVSLYNKGDLKKNEKGTLLPIKELRQRLINNVNFEEENQWMLEYDYDLRDEALRTFRKNVISNLKKKKKFKMRFKSKRTDPCESISVLKKKWNLSKGFYHNIFSSKTMNSTESLPGKLPTDSKLTRNQLNEYYLGLTETVKTIPKQENKKLEKVIFIDPGVKNFYTGYSLNLNQNTSEFGKVITIGKMDVCRIARLLHHKHKLQSKLSKTKNKKKQKSFKKAFLKMSKKIKNLVEEMHKKITHYLTTEYDAIYLPKLNFHNCKKTSRRNREKLATYRHCELFNRIQMKTCENQTCKLYEMNEAFTSKTCSNCGSIDKTLGNKNVYKCKHCSFDSNRDYNGAINILLRHVTMCLNPQTKRD
jgi:transposase